MKAFGIATVIFAFAVVLSGCGGSLNHSSPETVYTPSGLQYQDLKVGTGTQAGIGDVVTIDYTVYTTDGTKLESTKDTGQPLMFSLGGGTQIHGLEEGCLGMRIGGQRRLTIPPNIGYGDAGKPPLIPGGATLVYYVDMIGITSEITLPSGVKYTDLVEGAGMPAQTYDNVIIDYTAWLENGTKFDSTADSGQGPATITLGTTQIIRGFDSGLVGVRPGGKRRLVIPPDQGYGTQGHGQEVPPNSTLIYEVEVRQVVSPVTTASGLKYFDYEVGSGGPPNIGDTVVVDYTGWLTDGTQFDSSLNEDREPFSFKIGTGAVIAGWDEGLMSMRIGGRRKLIIPPELGYGASGSQSGSIPPNATLVFQVEMKDIKPPT